MKYFFSIFLLFLFSGCGKGEEVSTKNLEIPVAVQHPLQKDVCFYVESIGVLQPKLFAEIYSQESGFIVGIHVQEGQYVSKGAPLFSVDPSLQKIALREAEAELGVEQANFQALEKKVARYKNLVQRDLIARVEWEELESQLEKSKNIIASCLAHVEKAKISLDKCVITSPIEGRVGKIHTALGLFVRDQNFLLTTLTNSNSLIVECSITEKEYFLLPKGFLYFDVAPLSSLSNEKRGIITFFDSSFEAKRGVLLVKGEVKNDEKESSASFLPGQAVRVRIPWKEEHNVFLIPQRAIRYDHEGPFLYVVTPDMTVSLRRVLLGEERESDRIILQGVGVEEWVIVDGHARVSVGCKVKVTS